MRVCVLGGGIAGILTAWYLQQRGCEVVVVDRQPLVGMECSYANGAQLSYTHAEPWASPANLKKAIQWMGRNDKPLQMRLSADPQMLKWLLRFVYCSRSQAQVRKTTDVMARIAMYSKAAMADFPEAAIGKYNYQKSGILHTFSDKKALQGFKAQAEFQKTLGLNYDMLSVEDAVKREPSLKHISPELKGAMVFPDDEVGDMHLFCTHLERELRAQKQQFMMDTEIQDIIVENNAITAVKTSRGDVVADHYVMALGAYSSVFMRKMGMKLPVYPMKGYSISIDIKGQKRIVPKGSVTNHDAKVVFTRLGDVLRVAGTAELAGYSHSISKHRIAMLKLATKHYFPECENIDDAAEWSCLRPCTPDGPPILGESGVSNLTLNAGQGTLGWTQGAGCAKIVADMVVGKTPEIDLSGLTRKRF